MDRSTFKEYLEALYLAADPDRQGLGWPDPVAWDGRRLETQASDLLASLDLDERPAVRLAATRLSALLALHESDPCGDRDCDECDVGGCEGC